MTSLHFINALSSGPCIKILRYLLTKGVIKNSV